MNSTIVHVLIKSAIDCFSNVVVTVSFDVHFDFTQAGRVRVKGRQICYDTFSPTAGKALCSSKGFIYASHER